MPADPLLRIRGLTKTFARRRWWKAARPAVPAIRDVTLQLERGRTLGLVGPSGSGKSTLARCLTFFEIPTSGEIWFEGCNLCTLNRSERMRVRARIQLIFQEPAASLNPRFTASEIIAEPLLIQNRGPRTACLQRALEFMELVGLPRAAAARLPHEFSGGQRQRLAIARALVLNPKLLILDESFSGLDLSLQEVVAGLLTGLRQRFGLTYVLISHDLSLVAQLADEIAVMESGIIVEHAGVAELCANPQHPRTKALLDATLALTLGPASGLPARSAGGLL